MIFRFLHVRQPDLDLGCDLRDTGAEPPAVLLLSPSGLEDTLASLGRELGIRFAPTAGVDSLVPGVRGVPKGVLAGLPAIPARSDNDPS